MVQFRLRDEPDQREIPRPAGKNAGLRDDAVVEIRMRIFKLNHYPLLTLDVSVRIPCLQWLGAD